MTTVFIAHLSAPSRRRVQRRGLVVTVMGVSIAWPAPPEWNGDDPFGEYLFLEATSAALLERVLRGLPEATLLTVHTKAGLKPATLDLERDVIPVIDRAQRRSIDLIDEIVGRKIAIASAGESVLIGLCVATRSTHLVVELNLVHSTVTAVAPRERCRLVD